MTGPLRLDRVPAARLAGLLALAGAAVGGLVWLDSPLLAIVAAVVALATLVGAAAAGLALHHDGAGRVAPPDEMLPAHPLPAGRPGFRVREAQPGEIPAPYLSAVMKGAQATRAALRARQQRPAPPAGPSSESS